MIFALLLAAQAQVVAVLEFRDKVPAEQRIDAAYLSDQVRSAVKADLPSAKIITRENMLVLLQSSGKKLEECEGECEVETGRRIGADLVVSGELLRFGTQYKLNMKLHDTRSGELISGAVASGASADDLDRNLKAAVAQLVGSLRAQASRPPPQAEEQPFLRPALSAHAVLGFGDVNGDSRLVSLALTETTGSETAFSYGVGADAGIHLGSIFSVGAFGEYCGVSTVGNLGLYAFGAVGRFWIAPAASVAAGIGLGHLAASTTGPAAMGAFDYAFYGALAAHAQVLFVQEANSTGLFDGSNRVLAVSAGLAAFY